MTYKPTIGLEIHTELKTNSKMFCSCKNDPDEKRPNFNICHVCMAHPGALPVANEEAIKMVIKTGMALNCEIAKESKFDRKNYFYPDLPKGYQISQYDQPLCGKGFLKIGDKKIGITRIHLEEDTGSLVHLAEAEGNRSSEGENYSLVNYNRAGVPLMELVTEPDITSGKEAKAFAEELQLILRYLNVSDANMEKGQMRVEVNISVSPSTGSGQIKLGTKVEIKNLNSFRVVEKAVDFEIARQTELLENGEKVVQETRGWHDKKEITFSQREKEEAHDYRYFPEPDLPPMYFKEDYIINIKTTMSELPEQKRERFKKEFGLDNDSIEFFVTNKDLSEYYEKVVSEFEEWTREEETGEAHIKVSKLLANYLISDVKGLLLGKEFVETEFKITSENFAEFIKMIYKEEISSKVAKMLLIEMFNTGADPSDIVKENNWGQMKDDGELEKIIKEVIEKNPKVVADFKAGKQNAMQFLAGQVMASTRGTANPGKVHELLKKLV
ncbi:MAG: glutaminyl-tRNA synthase (glutamine-hydrolyzing) subunit B [Candidatus Staskawiczbacteria bacterium RIFOXYB2_FULL_32_9]|uniref:Aspartyl/glutamyl-tRNA(Asn/Gln) amidotransferase subunit B n=1 Tax=Candidatus Staskawiczbacteria bacterium RIFOXYD1_FULL_32_13 TaxID=1802234 RepID=A0A1G2JPV8_9BACT|nr:MAG: Aspartyl/glutamyl-tRNA(Asn/Gln) amidotransferase subunit B [Parcubacteria group bacterium GW2011_GWC2_32_10]OGZ79287.1 MAG: glutaminyl-tRNA synthase (glutamine-hydrolyzing) subunit B [Candidatus Staskawiczbacteria bacterium RIFOXYB1_FULL_32_11]OGZ79828.1 MAG: glutaminyl-tRNA synthase (glutamine-hydrolyzing) subunit B [Candidatus Staskawiczbacteria bacterium RIFOXYA2_FULL_32_7]OGZ84593.1 MAG: glutaminyl-tRNA synthase (glutamine-hydrolyzing) subunit B [Candidatus Staskawiczbacteria bacteri